MTIKTEHCGAKHGNGAYWGRKRAAKKASNTVRRRTDKKAARRAADKLHRGEST